VIISDVYNRSHTHASFARKLSSSKRVHVNYE